LSRVVDATAPALGGLDRAAVEQRLNATSVTLVAGDLAVAGASRDGFLLAANLLARLYPRIVIVAADELAGAAATEITLINPIADVDATTTIMSPTTATLLYEVPDVDDDDTVVAVFARGWNVYVDQAPDVDAAAAAPAALLAAAVGASELFRIVFADDLDERGRRRRQPGAFNLVTLGEPEDMTVPDVVEVGEVRLVGAGAIGQAAAQALLEIDADIGIGHQKRTQCLRQEFGERVGVGEHPHLAGEAARIGAQVLLQTLALRENRAGMLQ